MNLSISQQIDTAVGDLEAAGKILGETKALHGDRADQIFAALFTLLVFRAVEKEKPGTLARLFEEAKKGES